LFAFLLAAGMVSSGNCYSSFDSGKFAISTLQARMHSQRLLLTMQLRRMLKSGLIMQRILETNHAALLSNSFFQHSLSLPRFLLFQRRQVYKSLEKWLESWLMKCLTMRIMMPYDCLFRRLCSTESPKTNQKFKALSEKYGW
jgi:hypothetical protein